MYCAYDESEDSDVSKCSPNTDTLQRLPRAWSPAANDDSCCCAECTILRSA